MSYAEHGPRIFLEGGPGNSTPLTYGDYVLPKKRSEGRLKLYDSCMDIRAWSSNVLESTRYFRELSEHTTAPEKVVPHDVIIKNLIRFTTQAQNELRVTQRELRRYKCLELTPEQQKHLNNFDKTINETRETKENKIDPIIRPLSKTFIPSRLVSPQHFNTCLSLYFHRDKRFQYNKEIYNSLLANIGSQNSLSRNSAYLVSRVTSCNLFNKKKTRECCNQVSICIEYIDASSQATQDVRETSVQTDEYNDTNIMSTTIDDYDKQIQSNADSSSNQCDENSESESTFESDLRATSDLEVCDHQSHKGVIIQKDSEIIVLKNELSMKEDELEEFRGLNRHLQELLQDKDENANILRRNLSILQEKMKIVSDKRNNEVKNLCAKLSSAECLMNQMKAELNRKYEVCHIQSQEIQNLRAQLKDVEILSMENESLARKVKKIEHLSEEAESCGIALEQVKSVWRERDILQEQYREQSYTLADREDEIKRLLMLIKQMTSSANNREVEMNDVVADLKNEIQAKNDKISQCEMQLVCLEREVGNLTNMLKNSLNNLDESKIAYESICEYNKCEHDTCLDVQSALSALKVFVDELEECKQERRSRLRKINNLKACMASYSQESANEITNTDFDTKDESTQPGAENVSTSSNCDDCESFKELINAQIQSDNVETTTTCSEESEKVQVNEVISYEDIDRALATHIKRSINKIHEISTFLQGAGDHHVQIIKEHAKQQQELQKRNFEIVELKRKMAEQIRKGEGDCSILEQLKKRMLEKEKMLETVVNKRDLEIVQLRENLNALEDQISDYRAERDTLKNENADLVDVKDALSKDNKTQSEELRIQRDQKSELVQEIGDLKLTVDTLKEKAEHIDDMEKKLMDMQMRNNDLTNQLIQANETISKNDEVIADLRNKDEENRMALTYGNIKYDAMITQKHSDILKLQDENRSLGDQLKEAEIRFVRSADTISLLKKESEDMMVMNILQTNLSNLDKDKEKLLTRVDSLKSELASYEDSKAHAENELKALSHKNETLKSEIQTVRSSNDQLLEVLEDDVVTFPLKDALCTLPGKIYKKIMHLRGENKDHKSEVKYAPELFENDVIISEDERGTQQNKIHEDKSCQQDEDFYTCQPSYDISNSIVQAVDFNYEDAMHKLKFLETQHNINLQQIKNSVDDVKLRDYEIKNLQECITYLLQEKNEMQDKVKCQAEEYQNKLILLKKKYDSSLNAFRKRHDENVERLQARFEDIMKTEKAPFDEESWLQSLSLKELSELHNRISILSSHAAANGDSNVTHIEGNDHYIRNNTEKHNRFILYKEYKRENKTSLNRKWNKKESTCQIRYVEDNDENVKKLYSRADSKLKREHRFQEVEEEHLPELSESKIDNTLADRQREKFIYQCSVYHILRNGC